jgi:hypothetical protein
MELFLLGQINHLGADMPSSAGAALFLPRRARGGPYLITLCICICSWLFKVLHYSVGDCCGVFGRTRLANNIEIGDFGAEEAVSRVKFTVYVECLIRMHANRSVRTLHL